MKTLNNTYWKKKTLKIIIEITEYGYSIDKTLFLKWIPHFKHLTDIASKKNKKSIKIDLFLEMDTTFQTDDAYHVEIPSFFQNKVFILMYYGYHVEKWTNQSWGLISQCIQRIPR